MFCLFFTCTTRAFRDAGLRKVPSLGDVIIGAGGKSRHFPMGRCLQRLYMAAAVVEVVFNFTIKCHVYIKYFGQERESVNESTLELRISVPSIPRIYDDTFCLKKYKFICGI